ncbi:IPT/TIG domain-containing protein [Cnuibacter physcomitrellae]|uniref:IPT/TIG domain-containing protein n=1 Tax=Cnuibacter physcomitrellae TaxID=1619308 RepID=UPI002175BFEB|nr:IPT/TIG domain-containing protein [Cnuibacter physcomitrellae]MCS5495698.1 IPT/TIG domain-containing protein [Cnuibacter physcomitrellae]
MNPGDSLTVGAAAYSTLTIADIVDLTQSSAYGALAASVPGEDSQTTSDAVLLSTPLIPDLARLEAGTVSANVKSSLEESVAFSVVDDTDLTLFGLDVLGLGVASATATCPVVGEPSAAVVAQGLTVFGIPVTLDESNRQYQASVQLPASVQVRQDTDNDLSNDVEDLSGVALTVAITQVEVADPSGAVSIALAVHLALSGSFGSIPVASEADLVLALAACLTPLSLSNISPASGTTAGGEKVTLRGTAFSTGDVVTFGGEPATDVVVAEDGRSLTATTPAHAAGAVDVTVTTAGGLSASLPYTYVAPVVPVNPVTPASTGTTTLAATGADPVPTLGLGAGVLALGLGALLATAAVRRRRA